MAVPPPWHPPSKTKKFFGFLLLMVVFGGALGTAGYVMWKALSVMPKEWKVDVWKPKREHELPR